MRQCITTSAGTHQWSWWLDQCANTTAISSVLLGAQCARFFSASKWCVVVMVVPISSHLYLQLLLLLYLLPSGGTIRTVPV